MDAAVYAERKAAKIRQIDEASAQLDELAKWVQLDAAQRSIILNAAAQLNTAANRISTLGDGLRPYSEPGFYRDLPPSLAKEDQGKHAASALEYVFSE
jgi:hypothetical protein